MRRWAWLWLPAAFFVMCAGWALTSPPGSSPDDDFHLTSIWCANGTVAGRCEGVPGRPLERSVPAGVVDAAACFAFKPEVSAACVRALPTTMVATDRVNATAGLYPGGYYRVMGLFVGDDVGRSVLVMRLVNAALTALLLALVLRVLPRGVSRAALLTVTSTFVPMGLFLVASTNPSGWAVVAVPLYVAFGLALAHRTNARSRRTWLIAAGTVVTAAMAISARVDSAAFIVLATLLVGILAGWRRLVASWPATVLLALLALAGALTYLAHGAPTFVEGTTTAVEQNPGLGHLLTNLVYLPILFQQAIGFGGLGWNDTALPPLVGVVDAVVLGGLAYAGLQILNPRKAAAVIVAALATIAIPLYVLQREGLAVGQLVQPRYILPLVSLLLLVLLLGPRPGTPVPIGRVSGLVIGVALSISAGLAFWANLRRYAFGAEAGLVDMKAAPSWTFAAGLSLWLVVGVTAVATAVFVLGVAERESGVTEPAVA